MPFPAGTAWLWGWTNSIPRISGLNSAPPILLCKSSLNRAALAWMEQIPVFILLLVRVSCYELVLFHGAPSASLWQGGWASSSPFTGSVLLSLLGKLLVEHSGGMSQHLAKPVHFYYSFISHKPFLNKRGGLLAFLITRPSPNPTAKDPNSHSWKCVAQRDSLPAWRLIYFRLEKQFHFHSYHLMEPWMGQY